MESFFVIDKVTIGYNINLIDAGLNSSINVERRACMHMREKHTVKIPARIQNLGRWVRSKFLTT